MCADCLALNCFCECDPANIKFLQKTALTRKEELGKGICLSCKHNSIIKG